MAAADDLGLGYVLDPEFAAASSDDDVSSVASDGEEQEVVGADHGHHGSEFKRPRIDEDAGDAAGAEGEAGSTKPAEQPTPSKKSKKPVCTSNAWVRYGM